MKQREIINNYGPIPENIRTALAKALIKAAAEIKSITIIVPDFSTIEGVITETYGKDFIKSVKNETPITFSGVSIKINIVSERTMSSSKVGDIALCIYVTAKILEKINDFYKVKDEIVVPWMEEDIQLYKKTWKL